MTRPNEKIRPPSHSSFKDQEEGELPEMAQAPDPMANRGADGEPLRANESFSPVEAQQLRREMNDPNRLGLPYRSTEAERLQQEYHAAWEAYKADYQGTRSERLQKPYLEAKQKMIDAGLMVGDV